MKHRDPLDDSDEIHDIPSPEPDGLADMKEMIGKAYQNGLFKRLTSREKTVYIYRFHMNLSLVVISKALKISISSCRLYLKRALGKLRKMVEQKAWCIGCLEYTVQYLDLGRNACVKCDHYTEGPK